MTQPVVTDKFRLIVRKAPDSVVFKLDVIGMTPDRRYENDPIFSQEVYEEGNDVDLYVIESNYIISKKLVKGLIYD